MKQRLALLRGARQIIVDSRTTLSLSNHTSTAVNGCAVVQNPILCAQQPAWFHSHSTSQSDSTSTFVPLFGFMKKESPQLLRDVTVVAELTFAPQLGIVRRLPVPGVTTRICRLPVPRGLVDSQFPVSQLSSDS